MVAALEHFLSQLQNSHLCKTNFFYNTTSKGRHDPKPDDIVLVKNQTEFENKNRIGMVTKVNEARKSITVTFNNGHSSTFPREALVMLCRASPIIHASNKHMVI